MTRKIEVTRLDAEDSALMSMVSREAGVKLKEYIDSFLLGCHAKGFKTPVGVGAFCHFTICNVVKVKLVGEGIPQEVLADSTINTIANAVSRLLAELTTDALNEFDRNTRESN